MPAPGLAKHLLVFPDPLHAPGGVRGHGAVDPFPLSAPARFAWAVLSASHWASGARQEVYEYEYLSLRFHRINIALLNTLGIKVFATSCKIAKVPEIAVRILVRGRSWTALCFAAVFIAAGGLGMDRDPTLVGSWGSPSGSPIEGMCAVSNVIYAACGPSGLEVIDASAPGSARRAGGFATRSNALLVAVSGRYACVAEDFQGLEVVDIGDSASPRLTGSIVTGQDINALAVSGNYAYVADSSGLEVIDFSDPANPQRIAGLPTSGEALDIRVLGNYAYLAEDVQGLEIIDISNPANPHHAGAVALNGNTDALAVSGGYAYAADLSELVIIDVSDPAKATPVGRFEARAGIDAVAVSDGYAYLGTEFGLEMVDISTPGDAHRVGACHDIWPWRLAIISNYAYALRFWADLGIVDLSPVANPQRLGSLGLTNLSPVLLTLSGTHAYFASGVQVALVDVTDPLQMQLVSEYLATNGLVQNIAASGNYVYLAKGSSGLEIVDVSDPAHPRRAARLLIADAIADVALCGNYAYLADLALGLLVVDISDPANPRLIGGVNNGGGSDHVAVSGGYAYVSDQTGPFFSVFTLTNPAVPVMVGRTVHSFGALTLSVNGLYAAQAFGNDGFEVIDISNPTNPLPAGYTNNAYYAYSVAVSGGYAYVAEGVAGLEVLDLHDPLNVARVGRNEAFDAADSLVLQNDELAIGGVNSLSLVSLFKPLRLGPAPRFAPDGFHLLLDGGQGQPVRVQRSRDLATWEDWQRLTLGSAPVELNDPQANAEPRRFYRALIP